MILRVNLLPRSRQLMALAGISAIAGVSAVHAGTSAYRNLILSDNPIVYYELDEQSGTTTTNSATTGGTFNGTFDTSGGPITVGQASFAQGGTAYDFGGGFIASASAVINSLDEWTVEAWVNYDSAKTSASNFLSNDQAGWNNDVLIGIGPENSSIVPAGSFGVVQHGSPDGPRDGAGVPITAGQWAHVVVTGSTSAGTLTVYVNGAFAASDTSLSDGVTFNGADGIGTANLTIGAARPDHLDAGYRPYDGLLDEVAIYDSVLDPTVITEHFNAGSSTLSTPPEIVSLSPANGTEEVPPSSNLVATFNELLVLTNNGTVTLRNLTSGASSDIVINLPDSQVSVSGSNLIINPSTDLALNTNYAAQISADALQDFSGDPFPGILSDSIWNFTTMVELDVMAPQIVSTVPADNGVELNRAVDLVATFDEPVILTGTGNVTIRNLTLGTSSDAIIPLPDPQVTISEGTLTINPSINLENSTAYAVWISGDAIEDLSGNPFAGLTSDTKWNFTIPTPTTQFNLDPSTYAPEGSGLQFRWPTHIAFGPGTREVVADLKNDRFVYRDSPTDAWQASPVSVRGPHSLVYNPSDGLYYADDTENARIIAISDLSTGTIVAETNSIAGVTLSRPHDILYDSATGWIYALNPNSGHVFRFTAIGENESAILAPVGGYARALTLVNGTLYVIGSAAGRIVEVVDWDTETFNTYNSFDPTGRSGPAGSWSTTGLVINDAEFFDGFWYATSYFTASYASGTDFDENKFIRFETFADFESGNWEDLNSLVPSGMTPYFLTAQAGSLYLAIFNHESPGSGDAILRFTPGSNDFSTWVSDPVFGLSASEQDFNDDPDRDSLANGIEAWFGTHPGQFTSGLAILDADSISATVSHPRSDNRPNDVNGYYMWSPNLTDWYLSGEASVAGPTVTISSTNSPTSTTIGATASEDLDRLFLRVEVIQHP